MDDASVGSAVLSDPGPATNVQVGRREPIYRFLSSGDLETADELVLGRWRLPRFDVVQQGTTPDFDIDPFGEKYWRFIYYSLRHTRHLIYAFDETGDDRYAEALLQIFRGFLQSEVLGSDYLEDPHTVAFATIMIAHITQSLDAWGYADDALVQDAFAAVTRLNAFLSREEHFEKEYNHGITQAAALVYTAAVFDAARTSGWHALGEARLGEVFALNVDADGAQIEQSPFYHFYTLKFFWQIGSWAAENGIELPDQFHSGVGAMVAFGQWFILPDGSLPYLGATKSTDVRDSKDRALYAEIEASSPEFAWFRSGGTLGQAPGARSALFETAGFAVARSIEAPPEGLEWLYSGDGFGAQSHLIFDVGPYRTAHSDLDALSLFFYASGHPLLTDSGLFSLEESRFQAYFKSTRAHNTVLIGGENQREGAAASRLHEGGDYWTYFSGEHELYDDARHLRGVLLLGDNTLIVIDRVDGAADREVSQVWNFPARADLTLTDLTLTDLTLTDLTLTGETFRAQLDGATLDATVSNASSVVTRTGETEPAVDGWSSVEYEERSPATTLYVGRHDERRWMTTVFSTEPRNRVEVLDDEPELVRLKISRGQRRAVVVEVRELGGPGESVSVTAGPESH